MKINVLQIFVDYFSTLKGERWTPLSILDVFALFGIPILAAILMIIFKRNLGTDLHLSLFTLFGVFIAVFMAVQGVLVALFSTPRKESDDPIVDTRLEGEEQTKKTLIKELSFSLSYLKLFSLISMAFLIVPISLNSNLFLFQWMSVSLAAHLILNLLVILKRLHSLFSHQFS